MREAESFAAWVVIVPIGPLTVIYFPPWACVFRFFRVLTRSSLLYTCCICFQSTFDERLSEKKTNQDGNRERRKDHCQDFDLIVSAGVEITNAVQVSPPIFISLEYLYQSIKIMISICILQNLQNKLTCFRDNLNTQRFIKCFIAIKCYACICLNRYE